ncbi:MAG: hypothetical protein K2P78_08695 [Gemmataceae bacterium]|nr:hypothetical protein [Gemmataceae bacterium]
MLGASTTFESFAMDAGEVWQSAAADMTVTNSFSWTGGNINAAAYAASVIIAGATGLIAPTDAGSVVLGSSLEVVGGGYVTVQAGTVNVAGESYIDIGADSTVVLQPENDKSVDFVAGKTGSVDDALFRLGKDSTLTAKPGSNRLDGRGILNNGGTVRIESKATVIVFARAADQQQYTQTAGYTDLQLGGGLGCIRGNGCDITGGVFTIETVQTDEPARVNGKFYFSNSTITFAEPEGSNTNTFGTFRVAGDVQWGNKGIYKPRVSVGEGGGNDLWRITGELNVIAVITPGDTTRKAVIQPLTIGWIAGQPLPDGFMRKLIQADEGIFSPNKIFFAPRDPDFDPIYDRYWDPNADPVKEWYIKKPD